MKSSIQCHTVWRVSPRVVLAPRTSEAAVGDVEHEARSLCVQLPVAPGNLFPGSLLELLPHIPFTFDLICSSGDTTRVSVSASQGDV